MSNVAIKFSHAGPSQGALPLAGRGRRIYQHPSPSCLLLLPPVFLRFMPEVAVLSLFLSESSRPQLAAPAWVLGARMLMAGGEGG